MHSNFPSLDAQGGYWREALLVGCAADQASLAIFD